MEGEITNIFFDFFGVISSEVTPVWLAKHFKGDVLNKIRAEISPKVDAGEMSGDEMYAKLSEFTGVAPDVIKKEFLELAVIDKKMVDFIKQLKSNYKIYLLSNALSSFLRNILEKNHLYHLFDKVFISSEIRKAKPSKEFFEHVLQDLSASAGSSIMIDDNPHNISGAISTGINGIVYTNIDNLKEILQKYEIKF